MVLKRWNREYFTELNQISKLSKEHVRNLTEGELVWLVDDFVKNCEYTRGRIIELGNDGVVPESKWHMELNRPVVKLVPVFYEGVSESKSKAGNVGATSNHQQKLSDRRN